MTLGGFLLLVVVSAVSGAIAQALAGYSRGGFLVSTLVGFVGAYIGLWLSDELGLPVIFAVNIQGRSFPVVWAVIGGVLFVVVFNLLFGRRL